MEKEKRACFPHYLNQKLDQKSEKKRLERKNKIGKEPLEQEFRFYSKDKLKRNSNNDKDKKKRTKHTECAS